MFNGFSFYRLLLVALLLFVIVVFSGLHINLVRQSQSCVINLEKAKFFLEKQFVGEAGLLRAAVFVYPENTTIYVANDNVLAARALSVLGSPLASKVLATLDNRYSGGWNGKIDILLGRDIPSEFYRPENIVVGEVDGYTIVYERMNTSATINDWYEYADLVVYRGLDRLLEGSITEAEQAFLNLTKMWDGYGFRDYFVEKHGVYQVYKCALFIYLYRALEIANSKVINDYQYIYDKCLEIISKAQDPVYGGIYTDYRVVDSGVIVLKGNGHDINTETTSIVVLALCSNYPRDIAGEALNKALYRDVMYSYVLILSILALIMLEIMLLK